MFAAFGRRERLDPPLDLIAPVEMLGEDPMATYLAAAASCRRAWRAPGGMDGEAPSTIGTFPAKAVLNGRIFDTTVLTCDIAAAIGVPHGINERLGSYVLHVAKALVPNVRAQSPDRYKDAVDGAQDDVVGRMLAVTGRDPAWTPADV